MILLVDVGNTNIVLGIYSKNKYVACWRISTDSKKTSDEYCLNIDENAIKGFDNAKI